MKYYLEIIGGDGKCGVRACVRGTRGWRANVDGINTRREVGAKSAYKNQLIASYHRGVLCA